MRYVSAKFPRLIDRQYIDGVVLLIVACFAKLRKTHVVFMSNYKCNWYSFGLEVSSVYDDPWLNDSSVIPP